MEAFLCPVGTARHAEARSERDGLNGDDIVALAMDDSQLTVDVRIEAPSGDAHEYVADPDSRDVRLRRTLRAASAYPAFRMMRCLSCAT